LHHDRATRARKLHLLFNAAKDRAIIVVQEVHGSRASVLAALHHFNATFHIFYSGCLQDQDASVADGSSGGILFLVNKQQWAGWQFRLQEYSPGRVACLLAKFRVPGKFQQFFQWGVHNHGIKLSEMHQILRTITAQLRSAQAEPNMFFVSLVGDFNLKAAGEVPLKVANPFPNSSVPRRLPNPPGSSFENLWNQIFENMLEAKITSHTHFNIGNLTTSRIDRQFFSLSGSMVVATNVSGGVLRSVVDWHVEGITDHAPTFVTMGLPAVDRELPKRIPAHICKHPRFQTLVNMYLSAVDFDTFELPQQIALAKIIFHHSADKLIEELKDSQEPSVELGVLVKVAKAIWSSDIAYAKRLVRLHALADSHISFVQGKPSLKSHPKFETELALAKSKFLNHSRQQAMREAERNNCSNTFLSHRIERIEAKAALWRPKAPFLAVHEVILSDQEVAALGLLPGTCRSNDPEIINRALAYTWGKVFGCSHSLPSMAFSLLQAYKSKVKWEWERAVQPSRESVPNFLRHVRNSGPGWDGVPYAAWLHAGPRFQQILDDTRTHCIATATPPDADYNVGMWVFPVKKLLPTDLPGATALARASLEARPLAMKCTDNKIVCATTINCIKPVTCANTNRMQRGFVPGRQLVQNVVDTDTYSRIAAMRCMFSRDAPFSCMLHPEHVANLAVTTFFDFTAAFPSVSHDWLFQVLKTIRMPDGLVSLVRAMYMDNRAYCSLSGSLRYLYTVSAGVLQGCPLSAALFNFALDPLLWLFSQVIVSPGLGHVLACADDLAATLRSLVHLIKVAKCFEIFQNIANLHLNPKKCVLVLNSVEATPHNIHIIRQWLSANIPEWSEFGIANAAKYLGFVLGPRAGLLQWEEPLKKFQFRVDQIARSGDSAAVSFRQFSSKAVSVLGYVAQLIPPLSISMLLSLVP